MEESTFELDRTLEIHLIQLSGFTNEEIEAYFFPLAHKALTSWKDAVSPQLTYLINDVAKWLYFQPLSLWAVL